MKLAFFFTRRQFGRVLTPLMVHSARLPPAFGMFYGRVAKLDGKLQLHRELVTCFLEFGPIFAGKFQFSGTSPEGRWTRKDHEEIEVHRSADCLHLAPS
jgi:hypothetical protein